MLREGFGTRLGALVIDIVFLVVVVFIIRLIGGGGSMPAMLFGWGGSATGQSGAQAVSIGLMILGFVISIGYSLTEIFMAGTPGKQILGIIIADESGVRATTQQLATRWMIKSSGSLIRMLGALVGVSIIVTFGGLVQLVIAIGCFLVMGAKRQAFHDTAAKTAVFKRVLIVAPAQGFPVMPSGSTSLPPPQV